MKNDSLSKDYIQRAGYRIEAIQVLMDKESYADVVRESQEVVELCLKAVLRASNIQVPRIHDVSDVLKNEIDKLPSHIRPNVSKLCKISKQLRRDRELAFYGTEDLTPSEFYEKEDAVEALENAKWVHEVCEQVL